MEYIIYNNIIFHFIVTHAIAGLVLYIYQLKTELIKTPSDWIFTCKTRSELTNMAHALFSVVKSLVDNLYDVSTTFDIYFDDVANESKITP